MFAVIESGGKQHRVVAGDVVKLERLKGRNGTVGEVYQPGDQVIFDRVLMMSGEGRVLAGSPLVAGAQVTGEVLSEGKHRKIRIVKFKRRKNYLRRQGHRQLYSEVRITGIEMPVAT